MKQMFDIQPNNNNFSFVIKNNSEQEKKAILLGSLINLNGELDDPDIEIKVPESHHYFIKRDLLGSFVKINEIKIYSDDTFEYFDKKIKICKKSSAGTLHSRIYVVDCKKEDKKYVDSIKFNLEWNANTHMEINIPGKSEFTFIFTAELQIGVIKV
jgi:hypothetical protein